MEDYRLEQSGQEVQDILNGAAMQVDLTAETERATEAEQTLQGNIDAEAIRIDALEEKVPSGASASNKLATESYVDNSVATATATFRGTFNLVSDLHLTLDATEFQIATALALAISTADNNDYCFVQVPTSSETPTEIKEIDRYKFNGTAWSFEYKLNNSGFTAAQWAAINSGITSGDVTKLAALPTNAQLTALLAGKQDVLTFDNVPTEGSSHPVKSGGVYSAINDEKTARETADSSLSSAIEAILLLIPSAATSLNKLADKSFVNSSIATASATFRGTYNLVTDLSLTVSATHAQIATALEGAVSDEDNNDYAFVQIPTSDATPTQIAKTERYKYNGTIWEYEYDLNNSGYTAAQWAAINSGITEALVTKLSALPTNAELTSALGVLTSSITTINQKIPSAASQANQLVDTAAMEAYIVQVLDVLTASFNVTSTDGHVTVQISQVDGKITSFALTTLDIASAASLSLVEGRVTTAEGNISTNAADIANLQDAYAALTQSALVVIAPTDTWPVANPEEQTIYRVVDRVNTPPQYYSDYMWNGTAMVLMATYDNAIDDVPTKDSNNLVKSGGVYQLGTIASDLKINILSADNVLSDYFIGQFGNLVQTTGGVLSVSSYDISGLSGIIKLESNANHINVLAACVKDVNGNVIARPSGMSDASHYWAFNLENMENPHTLCVSNAVYVQNVTSGYLMDLWDNVEDDKEDIVLKENINALIGYLDLSGNFVSQTGESSLRVIWQYPVNKGDIIYYSLSVNDLVCRIACYDEQKHGLTQYYITSGNVKGKFVIPEGVNFISITYNISEWANVINFAKIERSTEIYKEEVDILSDLNISNILKPTQEIEGYINKNGSIELTHLGSFIGLYDIASLDGYLFVKTKENNDLVLTAAIYDQNDNVIELSMLSSVSQYHIFDLNKYANAKRLKVSYYDVAIHVSNNALTYAAIKNNQSIDFVNISQDLKGYINTSGVFVNQEGLGLGFRTSKKYFVAKGETIKYKLPGNGIVTEIACYDVNGNFDSEHSVNISQVSESEYIAHDNCYIIISYIIDVNTNYYAVLVRNNNNVFQNFAETIFPMLETKNHWQGKTIVWFGTSIPAPNPIGDYPSIVGNGLGSRIYNEAVGWSCAKGYQESSWYNMNYYALTVAMGNSVEEKLKIFNSLFTLDFSLQSVSWAGNTYNLQMCPFSQSNLPSYEGAISLLHEIIGYSYQIKLISKYLDATGDYLTSVFNSAAVYALGYNYEKLYSSQFDYVGTPDLFVIDHGHNDHPDALLTPQNIDSRDIYTFHGAINSYIDFINLYTTNPNIIIISDYDDYYDSDKTIEVQKQIAYNWKIPFLPVYDKLPFGKHIVTVRGYWDNGSQQSGVWQNNGFYFTFNSLESTDWETNNGVILYENAGSTAQQVISKFNIRTENGVQVYDIMRRQMYFKDGLHPTTDLSRKAIIKYAQTLTQLILGIGN